MADDGPRAGPPLCDPLPEAPFCEEEAPGLDGPAELVTLNGMLGRLGIAVAWDATGAGWLAWRVADPDDSEVAECVAAGTAAVGAWVEDAFGSVRGGVFTAVFGGEDVAGGGTGCVCVTSVSAEPCRFT